MPLWRDPFDELIDDLERSLPQARSVGPVDYQAALIGCQLIVAAILHGTEEDRLRAERDPRVQMFYAELGLFHRPQPAASAPGDTGL